MTTRSMSVWICVTELALLVVADAHDPSGLLPSQCKSRALRDTGDRPERCMA